jgi:hypothetical protein
MPDGSADCADTLKALPAESWAVSLPGTAAPWAYPNLPEFESM